MSRHYKNRADAYKNYIRTGRNDSQYDLNDYDEIAAITGWNVGRNPGRVEAFKEYHRTGENRSNYNLNDLDFLKAVLD